MFCRNINNMTNLYYEKPLKENYSLTNPLKINISCVFLYKKYSIDIYEPHITTHYQLIVIFIPHKSITLE